MRDTEKNKNNYDPRLVSIGPYHYGDSKLMLGHALKIKLVEQFSSYVMVDQNSSKWKSLEAYSNSMEFKNIAREARNCYAWDPKLNALWNEEAFKGLMFLDGCFVLYFIHCFMNESTTKDVKIKNDHKAIIIMDLFLLENQLPYMVLQALADAFMSTQQFEDDIKEFIKLQTAAKGTPARMARMHELIHTAFERILKSIGKKYEKFWSCFKKHSPTGNYDHCRPPPPPPPRHLLDFLRNEFLIGPEETDIGGSYVMEWQSFRSVEELSAAGISCRTSGSSSVKGVQFKLHENKLFGTLFLPAISIDDSFKTRWLNLAAYEACPDFFNDGDITSFLCLIDSLIDRPEDVKELREQGVLQNCLGSDQHVAELFNDLGSDLTPNPHKYLQVKQAIQKHFEKGTAIWLAEVLHQVFSSPWTSIAFAGALVGLILSAVQTYYAVDQAKAHDTHPQPASPYQ